MLHKLILQTRLNRFVTILLFLSLTPAFAQERGGFVENAGQWRDGVALAFEEPGMRFWLRRGEAWIDLVGEDGGGHVLRQTFVGATGGDAVGAGRRVGVRY